MPGHAARAVAENVHGLRRQQAFERGEAPERPHLALEALDHQRQERRLVLEAGGDDQRVRRDRRWSSTARAQRARRQA